MIDAEFGRFEIAEERPFNKNLPDPKRKVTQDSELKLYITNFNQINLTQTILEKYKLLINQICKLGDDQQYGSSVEADVNALRKISERIHFGAFYVAEAKYQENPKKYSELILSENKDGLKSNITNKKVENDLLDRIKAKTEDLQKNVDATKRYKVDSKIIIEFYRDIIIPLTKEGEIEYLMNRKNINLFIGKNYEFSANKNTTGFGCEPSKEDYKGKLTKNINGLLYFDIKGKEVQIHQNDITKIRFLKN